MDKNTLVLRLRFVVLTMIVLALGGATLVANRCGEEFASQYVYGHVWFVALIAVFFVLVSYSAWIGKVWKQIPSLVGYLSFSCILLGSFLSFSTCEKGYSHLIRGVVCGTFEDKDYHTHILPFDMVLDSFRVIHYPGTDAPMDYISYIRVDGVSETISMNNNLVLGGYRFCQSGSDSMYEDSWLSVNYDPYGVRVVYFGYFLFVLYGVLSLSSRNGRFRTLLSDPLLKKGMMTLFVLLIAPFSKGLSSNVFGKSSPLISVEQTDDIGRTQVVYQNRIAPLNTVAVDFMRKISGETSYRGLSPEQVLIGWYTSPEVWRKEKIILVKSSELKSLLNLQECYCCYSELFDEEGVCRLDSLMEMMLGVDVSSGLGKAIHEMDEKLGVIMMLERNTLFTSFPNEDGVVPLSETKVSAELLYNKLPMSKVLFMFNLTLGLFSFVYFLSRSVDRRRSPWLECVGRFLPPLLLLSTLAQTFHYVLRWYIGGRIPLGNGYETMQFMALCVMLFSLLLCRRWRYWVTFGFLMSGFALLVSHLGQMNPQITPLMPVLNSPWLSIHVSVVMMSYTLFAFLFLNSLTALVLLGKMGTADQVSSLTLMNRLLLYPSVLLLGVGIILGSIWANESWGCYWGWDPKEVWALISFLVYGAAIYFRRLDLFSKEKSFHLYLLWAFLSILMTYFGVNYFLGGLHSYATA